LSYERPSSVVLTSGFADSLADAALAQVSKPSDPPFGMLLDRTSKDRARRA